MFLAALQSLQVCIKGPNPSTLDVRNINISEKEFCKLLHSTENEQNFRQAGQLT